MIFQEEGERVEIQAFERQLHAIAQIEEGSIEEENLLKGKPKWTFCFSLKDCENMDLN